MKNLYLSLCLFGAFLTTRPALAQTHVATFSTFKNSSTNMVFKAFSAASTTGNLIVVHLSWDNQAAKVNTVTDSKGNTYARINGPTNWDGTNYRSELWYAYNITGGGAPITVTATLNSNSTSFFQIYISEFSGISNVNPLDKHTVAIGTSTTVNSGSVTTTAPNELIYGVSIGANGVLTTGAGFTNRSMDQDNIVETKVGATTGSYSAAFTSVTGNSWVAEIATFKPLINLPIDLISFDVRLTTDNTVKLDWATAMESNNSYFEVQHSSDGINWSGFSKVSGAGNSNTTTFYSATDPTPYPSRNFYRLAQFDFDGQIRYSVVKTVQIDPVSNKKIRLYPVPAVSSLTVEGDAADLQNIVVIDAVGQWVTDRTRINRSTDQKIVFDLSLLPKGVYFIKTRSGVATFYKQ